MPVTNKTPSSFRLTDDERMKLKKLAHANEMSQTKLIQSWIDKHWEKLEKSLAVN